MNSIRLGEIDSRLARVFEDNRNIYRKLKQLLVTCTQSNSLHDVCHMFPYLQEHLIHHFQMEETLMGQNYPGFSAHKSAHQALQQDFSVLWEEHTQTGPSTSLIAKMILFVLTLLVDHHQEHDRPMEKYLLEKFHLV